MPGPQSAVGRNPTALFHLCARISLDGAGSGAAFRAPVFSFALPALYPRPPIFVTPAYRSPLARSRVHAVRAYPVGVCKRRPLHSAFADRAVGKIGRQFSYKENAEEGVRLDEKRRTMDPGTRLGWRRSYGVGGTWLCPRFHEPLRGRYARAGAVGRHGCFSGRCVRIHMNCRSSDLAPAGCVTECGPAGRPVGDRCLRIDRLSRKPAFPRLLHPDDIAAAHRDGRTTASEYAAAHARFTGKRA
ncbi:hypothetical protein BamMEX5DRAFT_0428 [Burkholderia ambifaria MEX-5]|uniref:Uncharacterized protein n=1 Tax=Burkholderia ambifaria MEX-5 TaxID=396597 RepID=B1SY12_9BURK|nr:hypothetical protein BamMEX5DRAFT_0428 [Burkholderia ambifaria MEX-5]